jgi:hypothetical protein
MRYIFRKLLTASAVSMVVACGGGTAEEPFNIDKYVGTWKSPCSYFAPTTGAAYYTIRTRTMIKTSATELATTARNDNAYQDAACTQVTTNFSLNFVPGKYTFGQSTSFLGNTVYNIVYSDAVEISLGYIYASSTQLYITTFTSDKPSKSWGTFSPYTKQ